MGKTRQGDKGTNGKKGRENVDKNELIFLTGPTLDNEKTWNYFAFYSSIARKTPK